MSTLKEVPHEYDSLRTLRVWATQYSTMLIGWHELFNGTHAPYTHCRSLYLQRENEFAKYTREEILASLGDYGPKLSFRTDDGISNSYSMTGALLALAPVPQMDGGWIFVIEGDLVRFSGGDPHKTSAKVSCYYSTKTGRGFCLLPDLARARLWSHNSN